MREFILSSLENPKGCVVKNSNRFTILNNYIPQIADEDSEKLWLFEVISTPTGKDGRKFNVVNAKVCEDYLSGPLGSMLMALVSLVPGECHTLPAATRDELSKGGYKYKSAEDILDAVCKYPLAYKKISSLLEGA